MSSSLPNSDGDIVAQLRAQAQPPSRIHALVASPLRFTLAMFVVLALLIVGTTWLADVLVPAAPPPTRSSAAVAATPTSSPPALADAIPGDVPAPYRLHATPIPWRLYPGIPRTTQMAYYEIIRGGDRPNEVGHLTVVHYRDAALAEQAYAAIQAEAELRKEPRSLPFGQQGSHSGPSPDWNGSDVLFAECDTVVHLTLEGNTRDLLVAFAERLHQRLVPLVCP